MEGIQCAREKGHDNNETTRMSALNNPPSWWQAIHSFSLFYSRAQRQVDAFMKIKPKEKKINFTHHEHFKCIFFKFHWSAFNLFYRRTWSCQDRPTNQRLWTWSAWRPTFALNSIKNNFSGELLHNFSPKEKVVTSNHFTTNADTDRALLFLIYSTLKRWKFSFENFLASSAVVSRSKFFR